MLYEKMVAPMHVSKDTKQTAVKSLDKKQLTQLAGFVH